MSSTEKTPKDFNFSFSVFLPAVQLCFGSLCGALWMEKKVDLWHFINGSTKPAYRASDQTTGNFFFKKRKKALLCGGWIEKHRLTKFVCVRPPPRMMGTSPCCASGCLNIQLLSQHLLISSPHLSVPYCLQSIFVTELWAVCFYLIPNKQDASCINVKGFYTCMYICVYIYSIYLYVYVYMYACIYVYIYYKCTYMCIYYIYIR